MEKKQLHLFVETNQKKEFAFIENSKEKLKNSLLSLFQVSQINFDLNYSTFQQSFEDWGLDFAFDFQMKQARIEGR